jgi:Asp-tRNA(Asn)/Glu-tRNA(Gln) amidotransferase A subunit family amidase
LTCEEDFEYGLEEAKIKDQERQVAIRNGTVDQLPLLHGIPVSIKELVSLQEFTIVRMNKREKLYL